MNFFRCYLFGFLLLVGFISAAWSQEQAHVLLLNSYHYGLNWTDDETKGVQEVLEDSHLPIEFHVEYMDTKRISDAQHFKNLRQLLEYKYRKTRFAAIVVTDNDAFNFLRQYRKDQIFAGVPVIFAGVNFFKPEMLTGFSRFTGVAETFEAGQTVGLMQRLHPDVQRIVVIIDATITGEAIRREMEPMLAPYAGQVKFEYWNHLSLGQLHERLPTLNKDTLVLLMPYARDSAGTFISYPDLAGMVAKTAPVPVYGTYDFYMGYGIVGGRLTSGEAQGQAAANILLKVLGGEDPDRIPVITVAPSEFQFDSRQLQRYGISTANLPTGSRILFQSWYETHRVWVWLIGTLSLVTLLFGLGWLRAYRVQRRSDIALRISEKKLLTVLERSSNAIFLIRKDGHFTFVNPQAENLLGYTAKELLRMSIPDTLPPNQAPRAMEFFQRNLAGEHVTFEASLVHKDGSIIIVEINAALLPSGDVLGELRDITASKKAEDERKESQSQLAAVINATTESIFQVDENGIILNINSIAAHRVNSEPQAMIGRNAFDFFPPDVSSSRRASLAEVFNTGEERYSEDTRNNHFYSLSYYPIIYNKGKVDSVVIYAEDITERKKASNALRESEEKLRGMFELSPLGIALNDMSGRYIEFNEAFRQICGYTKDELNALDYWAMTPKKYEADEARQLQSLRDTGRYGPYEKEYIRKDGSLIPILLNGMLITGSDGNSYIWSIVEDISERQRIMADLLESEDRFRQMFERHSAVMLLIDPYSGMIVDANPAAADFYGYPLNSLRGKEIKALNLQPEAQISNEMQQAIIERRKYFACDQRLANGDIRAVEVHSSPVTFKNKSLLFSIIHDVTDRKLAEEQIRHLAFYDALTKIPNRRLLTDRLDQTITVCKRNSRYAALMFLDLDNFKPLNDTHGHKVGDLLLVEAASRIASCIRETDTVARFGGDEFVIMLSELKEEQFASGVQAGIVAEKIRAAMAVPYLLPIRDIEKGECVVEHRCTSSIGVAVFNHQDSREDILKWADMAMYEAKKAGRNCVVFSDSGNGNEIRGVNSNAILHLKWDVSNNCGEPTIDSEHQKLFELANNLIDSMYTRDRNPKKFEADLEDFLVQVVSHFGHEETILARYHYEELEGHVKAHKSLIDQAFQLRRDALAGGIVIGKMVDFICNDVVAQHMFKMDRKFYPLFWKN